MGLVGDNFSRREVIDRLPGMSAMGHVRYSTTGETILRNVQPLFAELDGGGFAVGHNGNLTNGLTLRRQLVHEGAIMQSTSDTEVILHLVARARKNRFIDRFVEGLRQLEGAYSFVALTNKKLIGARDPLGIRPLVIGRLDGARSSPRKPARSTSSAPNTCATSRTARSSCSTRKACIRTSRSRRWRRGPASSNTSISRARIRSSAAAPSMRCARRWARELAREAPAAADVVDPGSRFRRSRRHRLCAGVRHSPTSSASSATTMSGRTFIEPTQQIRQLGVRLKHSANRAVVNGKRIVLVDNSIVRGTTSTKIVQMMRDAGAKEVHFRISSPPITHPDYYGIDTPERDKLLAATHDLEGMRQFIGADSLAFLSVDGIYRAMGYEKRDPARPQFTDHCFTGDYPTPLTDQSATEHTPRQLSLLAEAS